MDIVIQLNEASSDIARLMPLIERAIAMDDPAAPALMELRATIQRHLAEATRLAPLAVAEIQKTRTETQTTIAETQAQVAKAEQLIAEFDAPRPPSPPPTPLEPTRGRMLAAGLLHRYGVHKAIAAPHAATDAGDVAELPSGEFTADERNRPRPAAPHREAPPTQRPPSPGRELGSITSGEWTDD
jgi:hypothetical protein